MGLTLEQANLDFTLTYRDGFAEAGDLESAAVCQTVHDDEIAHVALAARWLASARRGTAEDGRPTDLDLDPLPGDGALPARPCPSEGPSIRGRSETPRRSQRRAHRARPQGAIDPGARGIVTARLPLRGPILLPNLGAEEGEDLAAYPSQPAVRVRGASLGPALLRARHTLPARLRSRERDDPRLRDTLARGSRAGLDRSGLRLAPGPPARHRLAQHRRPRTLGPGAARRAAGPRAQRGGRRRSRQGLRARRGARPRARARTPARSDRVSSRPMSCRDTRHALAGADPARELARLDG